MRWVLVLLAIALPALASPSRADAAPALELELRYANGYRPIAGRSFSPGKVQPDFDGRLFNVNTAGLNGGEISIFGRGNVWAFGPMVSLLVGHGPTLPWTGSGTLIVNARMGFEGRATFSRDRFTGWAGAVIGMSILSMSSGVHRVVPTCDCPANGSRLDFLLEPRVGLEYAVVDGFIGRIAFGGWGGAEPLTGSWTAGLLFSARIHLIPKPIRIAFH
jgi:hypothetical protein